MFKLAGLIIAMLVTTELQASGLTTCINNSDTLYTKFAYTHTEDTVIYTFKMIDKKTNNLVLFDTKGTTFGLKEDRVWKFRVAQKPPYQDLVIKFYRATNQIYIFNNLEEQPDDRPAGVKLQCK